MLKRGWTTHIVNFSSKKRKFTTSNIKTLTATYLLLLHVKVSSFTAINPRLPAKLAYKQLRKDWKLNGKAWLLGYYSKLSFQAPKEVIPQKIFHTHCIIGKWRLCVSLSRRIQCCVLPVRACVQVPSTIFQVVNLDKDTYFSCYCQFLGLKGSNHVAGCVFYTFFAILPSNRLVHSSNN